MIYTVTFNPSLDYVAVSYTHLTMFRDELITAAKDFGLVLTTEQIDRFCLFAERLVCLLYTSRCV